MKLNKLTLDQFPAIAQDPDKYSILLTATDFREKLITAIQQATNRIYIAALYLENDEAGREILTELYEAKQRNPQLKIRIFIDWHRAQRGLIGQKKSDGNCVAYREFHNKYEHKIEIFGVPIRPREIFGVLHLKGFIIDDEVIYSGASINNLYLNKQDRYRCDRYHVLHNSSLANCMVDYLKQHMMNNAAVNPLTDDVRPTTKSLKLAIKRFRSLLTQANYQFETDSVADHQVAITPIVSIGKWRNRLNASIRKMIASSKNEIVILTPYFNFPKPIAKEVKKALKRGVKITLIVGDKTANDFYIPPEKPFKAIGALPYLYEINLKKFAQTKESYMASRQLSIHLWKHEENSFHLKGIWVDQAHMLMTGHNLNPRAWGLDLENAIAIQDPNKLMQEKYQQELDMILQHTTLVGGYRQLDSFENYPVSVQKLLKKIKRVRLDRLLKRLL